MHSAHKKTKRVEICMMIALNEGADEQQQQAPTTATRTPQIKWIHLTKKYTQQIIQHTEREWIETS